MTLHLSSLCEGETRGGHEAYESAGVARADDGIDVSLLRCLGRGAELALVLSGLLCKLLFGGASVDDLACSLGAHHLCVCVYVLQCRVVLGPLYGL